MRPAAAAILFVLCATAVARADAAPGLVGVDLVADTTTVQAGKPFTLGVRFRIDPGWHVYWTNPGDSGLPTRVKVALPAGFVAGPVQYPVPQVIESPGGIENYGYESAATLLVTVTPPASLAVGTAVPISADVTWLVCQDRCVPGRATVRLDLPVGTAASPDHAAEFAAARLMLPQACDADVLTSRSQLTVASRAPVRLDCTADVTWRAVPDDVAWVPAALPGWDVQDAKLTTAGQSTHISFTLVPLGPAASPGRVEGVLTYTAGGRRTGVVLPVGAAPSAVKK